MCAGVIGLAVARSLALAGREVGLVYLCGAGCALSVIATLKQLD